MQLADVEAIEPKEHVNPDDRTPGKDEAAEWIQEHVVEPDQWNDYTISQMADESGWSRQHIRNTIKSHYRPIEKDTEQTDTTLEHNGSELTITVPDDVDRASYLRGYVDAYVESS